MKEATGELNMTVITVVALAAVALLFYTFVWPMIKARIVQQTCDAMGVGYEAKLAEGGKCDGDGCFVASSDGDNADATNASWCCCPDDATK